MLTVAVWLSFLMLAAAATLTFRTLIRGPDLPHRVLALDTLYINAIALLMVYGIARGTATFFEAALLIALLGFISTVAFCKYLLRGDTIE